MFLKSQGPQSSVLLPFRVFLCLFVKFGAFSYNTEDLEEKELFHFWLELEVSRSVLRMRTIEGHQAEV